MQENSIKKSVYGIPEFSIMLYIMSVMLLGKDSHSLVVIGARALLVLSVIVEARKLQLKANMFLVWQVVFLTYAFMNVDNAVFKDEAFIYTRMMLFNFVSDLSILLLIFNEHRRVHIVIMCLIVAPLLLYGRLLLQFGYFDFASDSERSIDGISANTIGMYAAIGCVTSFWKMRAGNQSMKPMYVACLTMNLIVSILSASRKAILMVVIGVMLLYLIMSIRNAVEVGRLFVIVFVVAMFTWALTNVPILYNLAGDRLEQMINGVLGTGEAVDASTSHRMFLIEWGIEMIRLNPVTGYGAGNYKLIYGMYHPSRKALYSHNNFVEVAFSFGMIGLTIFYFYYAYYIIVFFRSRKRLNDVQILVLVFLLLMLMFEYGFVDYFDRAFQIILMLPCAVAPNRTMGNNAVRSRTTRGPLLYEGGTELARTHE